jgi:enterochelin esterase-like enzyme
MQKQRRIMERRGPFCIVVLVVVILLMYPYEGSAQQGRLIHTTFHASSLEDNLLDDSPDREVLVYLPPGYDRNNDKRFPVAYVLHGWVANSSGLKENCFVVHDIFSAMDAWVQEGRVKDVILVLPDSFNRVGGSWYTNSNTAGGWADYIARDLVEFMDGTFRTIANREGRAILGHSMGGYGALKIGMTNPEVFSCIGLLSAPIDFGELHLKETDLMYARVSKLGSWHEFDALDWNTQMYLARCTAFIPNPKKAPFYCGFPYGEGRVKDKKAAKKFIKHDGFKLVDEYRDSLENASTIYIECGVNEANINETRELHDKLQSYGIEHTYVENRGSHFSGIVSGSGNALEAFSLVLQFE